MSHCQGCTDLRLAATKLVDAMGHGPVCTYLMDRGAYEYDCSCGAREKMVVARGEMIALLRDNPQPPSSTV